MLEETSLDYKFLRLQVIPLILKVYDATPIEGIVPDVNRSIQYLLDKIENLPETFPIPENFHRISHEVVKGTFRYDLKLTFKRSQNLFPFSLRFPKLYEDLVSKGMESNQIEVFWFIHSPERLSRYQLAHLVREYGSSFTPACHSLFVSFELVGAWKGYY